MADKDACCSAPLWEQRYCLGPFGKPLWIVLVRTQNEAGRAGLAVHFYTQEQFSSAPELICDRDATLYKLPEQTVSVLKVSQVHPTDYIVSIEQLPPADRKRSDPFPPASTCTSFCPPYEMDCPPPLQPECVDNELQCVVKKKGV